MAKKKSPTWYRKKCVDDAKTKAKIRDNYTCQHCGKSKEQGWQMHGSHILPEGTYISMSADVDNIITLCAVCHTGGMWKNAKTPAWHTDPVYFGRWTEEKYPGLYDNLRKRAQTIQVINWKQRYDALQT